MSLEKISECPLIEVCVTCNYKVTENDYSSCKTYISNMAVLKAIDNTFTKTDDGLNELIKYLKEFSK